MLRSVVGSVVVAGLVMIGSAAQAGRTVIDQDPNTGNPLSVYLGGYCDFNGEDCDPSGGLSLSYEVSFDGSNFTNKTFVHGNGLLTFGQPVDFYDGTIADSILEGGLPLLTEYGRNLVSAGQSNSLDFGSAFLQSAFASVNPANGAISARWFTCTRPTAPGVCPQSNIQTLTLLPTASGFRGTFDFTRGGSEGGDVGYVVNGEFTPTGSSFFLPASFRGLAFTPVPEPAAWAIMTVGLGLVGIGRRRKRGQALRAAA